MLTQILVILRTFTNAPLNDITVADTDSLLFRATGLIADADPVAGQEDGDTNTDMNHPTGGWTSQEEPEHRNSGMPLMEAIDQDDSESLDTLLQSNTTSLQVVNDQGQTPLLLAAHLGKESMVTSILSCATLSSSAGDQNQANDHRWIDLDATDGLGRTILHYCAEFGMCEAASTVLDHGANINTSDGGDHPPLYYAIKLRQYYAARLFLDRGATKDFDWPPESTSHHIEQLFRSGSDSNGGSTAASTDSS